MTRDRNIIIRRALAAFLLFTLAALAPTPALAATINMTGTASCPSGSNWSTASCWDLGRAPLTGDDVVINNGSSPNSTNYDLGAGVQLHSVTFSRNNGACPCSISGGPIVLQSGGSITDNYNNLQTDSFPGVTLNGSTTLSLATSGVNADALHFTGAITGTGPLTLSNTGPADGLQLTVAST